MNTVALFAGPGGTCLGAHSLGLSPLGVEWDKDACATRIAAGLPTLQADVAKLEPQEFADEHFGGGIDGLIATPPCQAFSMAGKGKGRDYVNEIVCCLNDIAMNIDSREEHGVACHDDRAMLVVEPLRWALDLCPRWVMLEQVPPVLPLWEVIAGHLSAAGYSTWAGVLSAEQYGVPQTRKRAFLIASLDGPVQPPEATHQAYTFGQEARGGPDTLFGSGLLPWVSMAQALGWDRDAVVGFPRRADSDDEKARETVEIDGVDYRARDLFSTQRPAQHVTEKVRSWKLVNNAQTNAAERGLDEPAPTITAGHDSGERRWVGVNTGRDWKPGGTREDAQKIPGTEPAPTVSGKSGGQWHMSRPDGLRAGTNENDTTRPVDDPAPTIRYGERVNDVSWVSDRPATTVAGDPRVFAPGGHTANDGRDNTKMKGRSENAIRVTVQEAAVLQGFPADYPWQGSKSSQFRQIGNAVPPAFAAAVIGAAIAPTRRTR